MATRSTSSHRARSRNPHVPASDAGDQKAARAEQRRQGAKEDRLLGEVYDQGKRDARADARERTSSKRARRGVGKRTRKVRRAALSPTSSPTSGAQIVGTILALIALFLVLQNTPTFSKFIGGAATGLRWLASPATSIPSK